VNGEEPADDAIRAVTDAVAESRRYRAVDPAVVRRLAREELGRARGRDDAVKRVKRRLHQAVGAYRPGAGGAALARDLERLRAARDRDSSGAELRTTCQALLARHASTRERLPFLDRFYPAIWEVIGGAPARLLDLGCGLAPLALPWMRLPASTHYLAIDADRGAIQLVDGFLSLVGQPHVAEARDLAGPFTAAPADVALLLKLVPILDRQDPDAAVRLIRNLRVPHVVISFPVRSLGGRRRGMETTYRRRVDSLLADLGSDMQGAAETSIPNELVVVVTLRGSNAAPKA
jgi:16S rRNA (guanine(1405)-N(7))-methyltransferase